MTWLQRYRIRQFFASLSGRCLSLNASHAALNCALASSRLLALPSGGPGMLTVTFHSLVPGTRSLANRGCCVR